MKMRVNLAAISSAAILFFPRPLLPLIYENSVNTIEMIAGMALEVNGSPARGVVFAIKGNPSCAERDFLEMNRAEGSMFSGKNHELSLFRKENIKRTAVLFNKERGATAVCLDSEKEISAAIAPLAVEIGGLTPPPGSKCLFCIKVEPGRDGSLQAVYSTGASADSVFGYFKSQFIGSGWSLLWAGSESGGRSITCSRGKEWCFVELSAGICVISYNAGRRKNEKQ